jgi:apolipoprotein N-acyltransferase
MKRSFSKRVALLFWFIGSCGAVLFSCWWIFVMFYTRKIDFAVLTMLALGIVAAWEGFKMFRAERNSN